MNPEFRNALQRQRDFESLAPQDQWIVDKQLNILDWDGRCDHALPLDQCPACLETYQNRQPTEKTMTETLEAPTATEDRSMTLLNQLGDVTIIWKPENDSAMKEMIRAKLKQGIRFFVIKKIPLVPLYRRAAVGQDINLPSRRIDLSDKDLEKLVESGTVTLAKHSGNEMEFVKATKDVEEIATNRTAAMPQMVGG